ncbi:MAG: endonuclease [Stygiobacter sp. RIFOXYC12_FULL_38_8]|nr:MAG: endonuclease [Stygiobacter sp. GWC2_38_9]OGV09411.1 MAG: endonuclease [Stygiobacter sp. RIFOXYB2_FULL_37_11]OGV09903.1 MAG: endonuclease [Stygiobacter sp. RIFOXYA2_FULL_38_8]OGV15362.1 MAG: endonuclease [Stygiobacter sp. RIFOXYC2_FULL_38_25]OGV27793.1 MAG: endonuclease [Stygiobacter sp. RIFOXYC12_FULL_38_8]OGV79100.1 MAG: endonuclease [Stygiobacter sp. GWF2_38_21]
MNHGKVSTEIAKGLIELKKRIDAAKIPASKVDETLNIATWNIREFGKKKRTEAAVHYIAEILGQFDLIGIVELRDDLSDLNRVLQILGPYWKTVYSDMIPDPGGNRERIAYIYDKRTVTFTGLAAEANPPRKKKGSEYLNVINWWRSPYIASFRAGNFDFVVITAHIRWGENEKERLGELKMLADWVEMKSKEKFNEDKDILVMGDFNIPNIESDLFSAVVSKGLMIPEALSKKSFGTNLEKDKRYDQILHLPIYKNKFTNNGGVVDFYAGNIKPLFKDLDKSKFTYQMSDHLPLWIQINTDIEGELLNQIIKG